MLPLRHVRRWHIASAALLLAVLVAALMPAVWFWGDKRSLVGWFDHIDKWLHAITFVVLTIWFAGQYRRESYWRIGLGLVVFGSLIELCQRLLGYRSAEWLDLAADAAGIFVGLIIAVMWLGGWSLKFEALCVASKNGRELG
jgi:VanZ family protein